MKRKHLLLIGLICLLTFISAGCRTSYYEWTGDMSNQTGPHIAPFNPQNEAQGSQAIRLLRPTSNR
jgi:hypothetical protein